MGVPEKHQMVESLFDRIADDYTERSSGKVYNTSSLSFARRKEIVESFIEKEGNNKVALDYGMGPAVFAPFFVRQGWKYIGIDISAKMIEKAKSQKFPNCDFVQGDLDVLLGYQNTIDLVLLIGLIDYLEQPTEGLLKLSACVKEGGALMLSFRNRYSFPFILREAAKKIWRFLGISKGKETTAFAAPVLENAFSVKRDLMPLLKEAGFRKFETKYLDCSPIFFNVPLPRPMWRLGLWLDRVLSACTLSWFCASGVLIAGGKIKAEEKDEERTIANHR